jgi:hypothetical protein
MVTTALRVMGLGQAPVHPGADPRVVGQAVGGTAQPARALPVRQAAGYRTPHPSCADAMALVRHYLWAQAHVYTSPGTPDLVEIPRALLQR